jgi:hypothetical protein
MTSVLIIPSNRPESFAQFVEQWSPFPWDVTILMEDNPEQTIPTRQIPGKVEHLCWRDIEEEMGENAFAISRRDSAIRSFGFYYAWKHYANAGMPNTDKYFFTLDDDCYPTDRDAFVPEHIAGLHPQKWAELIPGVRTRGLPYYNPGRQALESDVHVGLWHNVPDFDAPQTLALADKPQPPFRSPDAYLLRHPQQYWPFCGMNFSWRTDITPLLYFPKMGMGSPYARFDDMWCGILLQAICGHYGWLLSTGKPHVWHSRASKPMVNLTKEAPGIRANEVFWELIVRLEFPAATTNKWRTAANAMVYAGEQLVELAANDAILQQYGSELDVGWLARHGSALQVWGKLFL